LCPGSLEGYDGMLDGIIISLRIDAIYIHLHQDQQAGRAWLTSVQPLNLGLELTPL